MIDRADIRNLLTLFIAAALFGASVLFVAAILGAAVQVFKVVSG